MRTSEVRIGQKCVYKNQEVEVLKKIPGKLTNKPNMHSGELFTGFKRQQKKFLLSSGDEVYSQDIERR